MTSRTLPQEEWPRLAGTEVEHVWPLLNPANARILVVEDDAGQIVGTWVLMRVVHVECLWIHPNHRGKTAVGRCLLAAMRPAARAWGYSTVITGAISDEIRRMITRFRGVKIPGDMYAIPVGDSSCQPQLPSR